MGKMLLNKLEHLMMYVSGKSKPRNRSKNNKKMASTY